jgi:hypothetical protein
MNPVSASCPRCFFDNENHLCSHADLIPLSEFVAGFPIQAAEPSKRQHNDDTVTSPASEADLLQKHPWLNRFAEAEQEAIEEATQMGGEEVAVPIYRGGSRPVTLSKGEVDEVLDEMKAKRRDWELTFTNPGEHFKTTLLGGTWTKQYRGMVCERTRAFSVGKDAEAFCTKYSLPSNMSFTFLKYGEPLAGALAVYFCRRLQYFFDLAQNSGSASYEFTPDDFHNAPAWTAVTDQLKDMPASHPGYMKLSEMLEIVPKAPFGNSSSSSRG